MRIIVPLAGSSKAFLDEGMKIKPLVKVNGKHMIEHIVEMFPKFSDFIFLCRKEELEGTALPIVLEKAAPNCTIISVSQKTRGSMETVLLADGNIDEDEEIIIHHGDSYADWDFEEFMNIARRAEGCLSVTTGFNPAAFTQSKYGLAKVEGGKVTKMTEKEPFALSPSAGYTSAGSYYFKSWSLFKKYAGQMTGKNIPLDGVFFDSLVYNEMIAGGLPVSYYIVKNFISWGEPANVNEYRFWSEYFETVASGNYYNETYDMINLIPSAGRGKRFVDAGYSVPKPMINIMGKPMILQAATALPKATKYIFVILKEQAENYGLDKFLEENVENSHVVVIPEMTDGMARTCLAAEHLLENKPVVVSSCDYSYLYSDEKFRALIEEEDPDAMIFTFRGYPDARLAPHAYGYVIVEDGRITRISEKVPISEEPHKDPVVQGTFYFKNSDTLLWCIREMIRKGVTVNGEYYVATAINQLIDAGKKVVPFELDKYICWGTPLDLKTFEFWENFFDSRKDHPYTKAE